MLESRRIALIGMAQDATTELRKLLEDAGASSERLDVDASAGGLMVLEAFDAVLLRVEDNSRTSAHNALVQSCARPLLLVASAATVSSLREPLSRALRDYALDPSSNEEIILRLSTLVPRAATTTASSPESVIVADDDVVTLGLLRAALTKVGFTCHLARDGQAALDLAQRIRPAAMILDVNMPRRNGFSVLQTLKLDPATAKIRTLMVTATADVEAVRRASSLGADGYIVKPFKGADVAQRLRQLVDRRAIDEASLAPSAA